MDKNSENGSNHEKRRLRNVYQNWSKKNVENSEIEPDAETLTNNTREPVDLSFNRLSFIQALGGGGPCKECGDEVLLRKRGYRGADPPYSCKKCNQFVFC